MNYELLRSTLVPTGFCSLPAAFETSSSWRDSLPLPQAGTGVICEAWALEAAVNPAKSSPSARRRAGIYLANVRECAFDGLDSRLRGNDRGLRGNDGRFRRSGRCFERDPIPNDTTTRSPRQDVSLVGKEETLVTLKNDGTKRECY